MAASNWDDELNFSWNQPQPTQPAADQPTMDQGFDASAASAPAPQASASQPPAPPPAEMMPSSVDPLANTPSAAQGATAPTDTGNPYASEMAALSSASSPEDQAVARNALMRKLYSDFQTAGHDVQWQGDQLIVDGLPYEVAGGGVNPADLSMWTQRGGVTGAGSSGSTVPTQAPPGYEQSKWGDPNYSSDKYVVGHIIASGGTPEQAAAAIGGTYLGGDRIRDKAGNVFDAVIDYGPGGTNAPEWAKIDFDASGHEIAPNFGGAGPGGGGPLAIPGGSSLPSVAPYTFSYDQFMQPTAIDQQTEANLSALLAHPESMDPHTVDVMKAQAKNDLTDQQAQEEQDILNLGYQGGFGESPWTQGQRLSSRFNRDVALSKSNTNIDIQAAQSRIADQRAAIDEGLKFSAQRQDKAQFAELAKQKAAELGISEQQVIANFTLGTIDAQLKKYGLDLDAVLKREGYAIDWAKIDQADRQHLLDLAFRYTQLNETASEFDATSH